MSFQKTVQNDMAWGIPGELGLGLSDQAARAEPFQLSAVFNGGASVPTPYGRAVTRVDNITVGSSAAQGSWQTGALGGDGAFLGLLHAPKSDVCFAYVGSEAPGIEAGTMLEAISECAGLWVLLTTAANVGDQVAYIKADGRLVAAPKGVAPTPADQVVIPGSRVVRFDVTAGLALVALQQLPTE